MSWTADQEPTALGGVRVVELGGSLSLAYATRLLALLGADVVTVRPDGPSRGLLGRYLDASKRHSGIGLGDIEALALLCADADILVEDLGDGGLERIGLGPHRLRATTPRLAIARLSAQGQRGAGREPSWTTFTLQAAAGWVNRHDSRSANGTPYQVGGTYSDLAVGSFAAAAALTALRAADVSGVAGDVDISMTASLHSMLQRTRMRLDYFRELGLETKGIGHQALALQRCRDGWVGINILTGQQWSDACAMIGLPEFADKQATLGEDTMLREDFERQVNVWCAAMDSVDVVELAQALRIPAAPLSNGRSVRDVPQWTERAFFGPLNGDDEAATEPGPPWRPSAMVLRNRPAQRVQVGPQPWGPARARLDREPGYAPDGPPLEGVRIVDLGNFYAAPYATQYLGALGADVVKIEGTQRPDGFRFVGTSPALGRDWHERSMLFQATNLNKRSVTLDLARPEGRELLLRLVEQADVVIENFSARVLDNFRLGHETLRARKADIITLRMPGFGLDGPWRDFVGFGPGFEQTAGLAHITGFPEETPGTPGGYLDPVVGMHAAVAIMAALEFRHRTGQGQLIEIAQSEVAASMAAEQILRWSATGEVTERIGNRARDLAPQGVYPCRSATGWVAISVRDDAEWQRLVALIGSPGWATRPGLETLDGRMAAHDEIDAHLAAWTGSREGRDLVAALQSEGVPAAEVLAPSTYLEDEHLSAWGYYQEIEHPATGRRPYPGLPFRAPFIPHHRSRSPLLGEHTHAVLRELLGSSPDELAALEAQGVIAPRPAGGA